MRLVPLAAVLGAALRIAMSSSACSSDVERPAAASGSDARGTGAGGPEAGGSGASSASSGGESPLDAGDEAEAASIDAGACSRGPEVCAAGDSPSEKVHETVTACSGLGSQCVCASVTIWFAEDGCATSIATDDPGAGGGWTPLGQPGDPLYDCLVHHLETERWLCAAGTSVTVTFYDYPSCTLPC